MNRVLHVIVEHVRVGSGSVLTLWSKQGWYLSYSAFFMQSGLIPELFCFYYNFYKYCKFTSTIYVCGSLSRNEDWPRICTFESNTLAGPFTTRVSNYSIIMPFEANAFLSCWDCSGKQLIKLANIFSSFACTGSSKNINAHLLSLVMW